MTSHKLIIAEKPSVAQSIAAVLGARQRRDGYLEGNDYLVSWCYGHLAELAAPEDYDIKYAKWCVNDLPIVPTAWQYNVSKEKRAQFDRLHDLMHREDVTEVVNACDAGREGELIFRTVYYLAGCTRPMKRLWISSMEDAAIREGFQNLRPGSAYDGLYQAALCRAKADWLVGFNATRLFSVLYHRTLSVGRVLSPTLALIVQREAEIRAFVPETFYTVELQSGDLLAVSERLRTKAEAEAVVSACQEQMATVKAVKRREKRENPPALYDLTTLQREANRLLGYTAQQTLDYLQQLYEKKLITYPRTDARYLTDDMASAVPALVPIAAAICGVKTPEQFSVESLCNSKKVTDHHAILPTPAAGKADVSVLPLGEREVMRLVARRLLCAVSEAHKYAETTVILALGGHTFTAMGKTVLTPGWKACAQQEQTDRILPNVAEGQGMDVDVLTIKEGKTVPPMRYTEDTLLRSMETAGAGEMPEDAEHRGIGTPATRALTVEKLMLNEFAERKKSRRSTYLVPVQTGVSLITVLPEQLQSPLLTAEWEEKLKEVERGALSPKDFMDDITEMVRELVQTYTPVKGAEVLFPSGRVIVGRCPRYGGDVTESKKGFFCESNECRFGLWKDNKFLTAKRINLTKDLAITLLKEHRAALTGLYSERTGKTYDATVVLEDTGEKVRYALEFHNG
ncbi:MAG: DNA topoisomerase 3 [Oscillospiraceae bacterium]|nr:DNA topoisomerase 3 [Oscillospiraceae bacterium]